MTMPNENGYDVKQLTRDEAQKFCSQLCEVLIDSVNGGASMGFLPPLSAVEASVYWQGVGDHIGKGNRILFAAVGNGEIFGTVQLELAAKQNAQHRAEVQKLMVHSKHRKKGIAKALMDQMEAAARETGRTLLVLDTLEGDTAERLYEKWNYQRAGSIPQYARCADGKLHPTVLFYKFL